MASLDLNSHWSSSTGETFSRSFNIDLKEANPADVLPELERPTSSITISYNIPKPPHFPCKTCSRTKSPKILAEGCVVPNEVRDAWDKLFKEGYGSDLHIITECKSYIPAHCSVLTLASPVLGKFLQQSKPKKGIRYLKIPGVPYKAVCIFIRFLYSSCYEKEEMKKFVLHLMVMSHCYSIPSLKSICIDLLEQDCLTKENVIDILQLARKCNASRLSLICVRMVVKDFKKIVSTEGWKVMKHANPALEQELLGSVVEADSRREERLKRIEEKKVYLQLHEAMEALLHICRDGCRTIGPHDKVLKGSQVDCGFPACKGLETLVRHFSHCKTRVPGGCVHCKRMWQLLELHSRMCDDPDSCKVPLCRHFKEKMQQQSKKDETKWRLLVSKVTTAKKALGPFSARHVLL